MGLYTSKRRISPGAVWLYVCACDYLYSKRLPKKKKPHCRHRKGRSRHLFWAGTALALRANEADSAETKCLIGLQCWSEQICLDTDTIHLLWTSHSLNNWQLLTSTTTLTSGPTHKGSCTPVCCTAGHHMVCLVSHSQGFSQHYIQLDTLQTRNMQNKKNTGNKTPFSNNRYKVNSRGLSEPKHISQVSYTAGMITRLNISWLLILASHDFFFFSQPTGPCTNMPCLPHYHFHFKIGLQNLARPVTHLSVQHKNPPSRLLSHTLRRNNNKARSIKFMPRL